MLIKRSMCVRLETVVVVVVAVVGGGGGDVVASVICEHVIFVHIRTNCVVDCL